MSSHHHLTEKKLASIISDCDKSSEGSELCHAAGVAEGTPRPCSVHEDLCLAPFPSVPNSPNALLCFVCMK